MALTQKMVIKLILDYIGGSKILGNSSSVKIGGKTVVVKSGGVGGSFNSALGGIVSSLANTGSISSIVSTLQRNPLANTISSITSIKTNLETTISSISNIPEAVANSMTTTLQSLQNQIDSFETHTNILSGLEIDITAVDENRLMMQDISGLGVIAMESLGMSKEEVLSSANSLFSSNTISSIEDSLNPNTPGGTTDILLELQQAIESGTYDETQLQEIADRFNSVVTSHIETLNTLEDSDIAAQENLKLRIDTLNTLATILPDPSNEIASALFEVVATDELKEINSTLESSANTD